MNSNTLFSDQIMPVAITLIMFGIGLSIRLKEFRKELIRPKALIVGLLCQMILLPLIAFGLAYLVDMPDTAKVGFVLLAASPGGTSSNLVSFMLRGRVALSIALTTINSFLILFTIPLFTGFAISEFMGDSIDISLPVADTLATVAYRILLPVSLGIWVNEHYEDKIKQLKPLLNKALPAILFIVFAGVLFWDDGSETVTLRMEFWTLIWPALILNIGSMLISFLIARASKIDAKGQFTIAIEAGLQNSALAVFIAVSLLENKKIATIAVLYSAFSFFTTFAVAYLMKHSSLKK